MANNENKEIKVSAQAESLYAQITRQTIEDIKNGQAPWQKHFRQGSQTPPSYNPASGKGGHVYAAFNRILLAQKGFADPRYVTFEQAGQMDLLVKSGSTHSKAVNFRTHEYVPQYDPKTGEIARDENNRQKKIKVTLPEIQLEVHRLFNVEQLQTKDYESLPEYAFKPDIGKNYAYLDSMFNWADLAFNPDAPENENDINFRGPWLREAETDLDKRHCDALRNVVALAHAEITETTAPAGSLDEARITLTQEIATWLLTEELGVYHVPDEKDRREQWLKYLEAKDEKQPFKLADCAQEADRVKSYVLDLEKVKEAKLKGEQYFKPDPVDMAKMQLWQNNNPDIALNVEPDGKIHCQKDIYLDDSAKYMANKALHGVMKDFEADKWVLKAGNDIRRVSQYLPLKQMDFEKKIQTPEHEFAKVLQKQEFELPSKIQIDGEYHNTPVKGGNKNDDVYRVTLREDKVPQLFFANNVTGQKGFCPYSGGQLTDQEINNLKEKAAKVAEIDRHNEAVNQEIAIQAAREKFNAARLAPENHAFYVENDLNGIADDFYRMDEKGNLLVPRVTLANNPDATHIDFHVKTIQHIGDKGLNYSEKGCPKTGTMYVLDTPKMGFAEKTTQTIVIAQSLESAITLKNSSEVPVVVAFEGFNIKPVAEAVREFYPNAEIYICPDHGKDLSKDENVAKAQEAGKSINAKVILPPLTAEQKAAGLRSFNDLRRENGISGFKSDLGMCVKYAQEAENASKKGGFER